MSEQPAPKPLAQRQGFKDGMTVAFWPDRDALPQAVQEFGEHHSVTPSLPHPAAQTGRNWPP